MQWGCKKFFVLHEQFIYILVYNIYNIYKNIVVHDILKKRYIV